MDECVTSAWWKSLQWHCKECFLERQCRVVVSMNGQHVHHQNPQIVEFRMVADFGVTGTGGEIKLFPPPVRYGELEKWED